MLNLNFSLNIKKKVRINVLITKKYISNIMSLGSISYYFFSENIQSSYFDVRSMFEKLTIQH